MKNLILPAIALAFVFTTTASFGSHTIVCSSADGDLRRTDKQTLGANHTQWSYFGQELKGASDNLPPNANAISKMSFLEEVKGKVGVDTFYHHKVTLTAPDNKPFVVKPPNTSIELKRKTIEAWVICVDHKDDRLSFGAAAEDK